MGRFSQIDGFRFSAVAGRLEGRSPAADLGRLQDLLGPGSNEIEYEIAGSRDDMGRPALRLRVTGDLQLTCQRCLKPLAFALRLDELLVLAKSEAEIEAEPVDPESPDRVVAGKEMDVGTLLEDEILLAIPFAPRHEECSRRDADRGEAKPSPFAELRGLLDKGGRAGN
ncbi:MAG: YceD family protein [Betaproteobacteria bacterium]